MTARTTTACLILSAAVVCVSAARPPQEISDQIARASFSGAWTLVNANTGGGPLIDRVVVVPANGRPKPGSGASDGAGTGQPGGRGGFVPSGSDPMSSLPPIGYSSWGDQVAKIKPKRLSPSEALRHEVLTPPEELTITILRDTVVIGDGIGAPITYKINNKTEAHQLVNGSIRTKTYWSGSTLRQDIDAGKDADFGRLFELSEEANTMRVSVGPKSALGGWSFGVSATGSTPTPTVDPRRALYKRKIE